MTMNNLIGGGDDGGDGMSYFSEEGQKFLAQMHRGKMISTRYRDERKVMAGAFGQLETYLSTVAGLIARAEVAHVRDLEKKYPPEENEEFWWYFYPAAWQDVHLRFMLGSFVVTAMSMLESHLERICNDVGFLLSLTQKPKRRKTETQLGAYERYLSQAGTFGEIDSEIWGRLKDFNVIRNALVHALDDVGQARQKDRVAELVEAYPGLSIEFRDYDESIGIAWPLTTDVLIVKVEFAELVLATIVQCLDEVGRQVSGLCERLAVAQGEK